MLNSILEQDDKIVYSIVCNVNIAKRKWVAMTDTFEGSNVDRVYLVLKDMAVSYRLKPDERINETVLSKQLAASRTPLREALNRLVSEGLMTFQKGRGFFCRSLDPTDVMALYETRSAIESATVVLACRKIDRTQGDTLIRFLTQKAPLETECSAEEMVALDEEFHMRIAEIAGNLEMIRILKNINARIRFVRWMDMQERRPITYGQHLQIAEAICNNNEEQAKSIMGTHIEGRAEQIIAAVKEGYARLYMAPSMFGRG